MRGSVAVRTAAATAGLLLAVATMAACATRGASTGTPTTTPTSSATSTPTQTPTADPSTALPSTCEELYSPALLASLQQSDGPLNDPGMQLYSTQIVDALEVLESGIPTIRCTWGGTSGEGFSTNASLVDADQAARIEGALRDGGFECLPLGGGTLCTVQSQTVDLQDNLVTRGESQYLGDGLWVTTAWTGALPDGYTQDVAQTLGE